MNIYLDWTLTLLYYIAYPVYFLIYYLALGIKSILSPLSRVLLFLLQPLFLFGRLVAICAAAPFLFLQRFETIYIYLGVASITGIVVGLLLHFTYAFLYSTLQLSPEPTVRGPTPKQYRASRKRKANFPTEPLLSPPVSLGSVLDTPGRGRHGLLAQTIHEEDSDF